MSSEIKKSIDFIKDFIQSLVKTKVYDGTANGYLYSFKLQPQDVEIVFNRPQLDDLRQYLIHENTNTDQFRAFWGALKFHIYIILGKEGLIPNIVISKEILNAKRDWVNATLPMTKLTREVHEMFYNGLSLLDIFLNKLIIDFKNFSNSELKEESKFIKNLIEYYNQNKHFYSSGVSGETLGYFKAAALVVILNFEKEKKNIKVSRILTTLDERIYKIVEVLQIPPFPQIKMPGCINDYVEQEFPEIKEEGEVNPNTNFFIACGQLLDHEKKLGTTLKSMLTQKGYPSFFAETVNDFDSLNTHIFNHLNSCLVFIAILHKRPKGNTVSNTSVWINQEVAIAAFLKVCLGKNIKSYVLYEEGADIEGLIKYTIINPERFSDENEALAKIEKWLEKENLL